MTKDPKFQKRIEKAMRRVDVFAILDTLEIKFKQQGGYGDLWIKCILPAHKGGRRASLHIMANPFHQFHATWKCFGCGASGNVIEFVKIIRDTTFRDALSIVEAHQRIEQVSEEAVKRVYKKPPPILPRTYESPKVESKWEKKYLDYLYGRGIEWWQIQRHKIGYANVGKFSNRIIVPVTLGKEFATFVARTILSEKEFPNVQRVTGPIGGAVGLFGSNYADNSKPAIVCEGWADKLKIERVGYYNVYSVQRNELHQRQVEFLKPFPYIIVIPDGDEGGDHFMDSLAPHIDTMKILLGRIPWGKDPAKCTDEEIETAVGNAEAWRPSETKIEVEIEY